MSTFRPAVPMLVEDAEMSKTVMEVSPGVFALNTVSGGSGSAEVAQIATSVGETTDPDTDPTVIGLLKSIVNKLL